MSVKLIVPDSKKQRKCFEERLYKYYEQLFYLLAQKPNTTLKKSTKTNYNEE